MFGYATRRVVLSACVLGGFLLTGPAPASASTYYSAQTFIQSGTGVSCYSRAEATVTRSGTTRSVVWTTSSRCTSPVTGLWTTGAALNLLTNAQGPYTNSVSSSNYVQTGNTYTLQNAALITIQSVLHVYTANIGPWIPVTCEGGRPVQMLSPLSDGECIATVTFNTDW